MASQWSSGSRKINADPTPNKWDDYPIRHDLDFSIGIGIVESFGRVKRKLVIPSARRYSAIR
jgi:hypothetical protein